MILRMSRWTALRLHAVAPAPDSAWTPAAAGRLVLRAIPTARADATAHAPHPAVTAVPDAQRPALPVAAILAPDVIATVPLRAARPAAEHAADVL